jgi:hypothetical protein
MAVVDVQSNVMGPRYGLDIQKRALEIDFLTRKRWAFARRFVSMDARVKPGHDGLN